MNLYRLAATVSVAAIAVANAAQAPAASDEETCLTEQDNLVLNPFNKDSAHHRPIGTDAKYAGSDDPSTNSIQAAGFGFINSNSGYGANVYEANESDPIRTVQWNGDGTGNGLPVSIHIPDGASNGNNLDSVIVIIDRSAEIAYEFYTWRWNNGSPTSRALWKVDIKALGHPDGTTQRVGTTASGMSILVGLMRGAEVNTPGCKIQHATQLTLSHGKKSCPTQLGDTAVWPAASTDWFCSSNPDQCAGNIPYGALLALPRSVDLTTLALSEPGQRLAEALQNYGAYPVDESECPNIRADQYVNEDTKQQLTVDMRKLWTHMRMVTNNKKDEETSGGGAACAENFAFDSPSQQYDSTACGKTNPPPPEQPKPDQPKPDQPQPDQPKPDQPQPDQPQPDQPKPDQPQPDQPKPDQPKPDQPKPDQPKPDQPKPDQPKPDQPKPVDPSPIDPPPNHGSDAGKDEVPQWVWKKLDNAKASFNAVWEWLQKVFG